MDSTRSACVHTLAAILILLSATLSPAKVIFVAPDGDGSDGASWQTAYPTITAGLAASATGDELWVKAAVYPEHIQLVTGVSLYGGFAGTEDLDEFALRDWKGNETIISESIIREPMFRGGKNAVLDGLIIRGGRSRGGVIRESMAIANCTIEDNRFGLDGAGLNIEDATVHLGNCNFVGNRTTTVGGGGGVYAVRSHLYLSKCVFVDNTARTDGGAILIGGSVLYATNCIVVGNRSNLGIVGGIECGGISKVRITHCTIRDNLSPEIGDIGAHAQLPSDIRIFNSIVGGRGGFIFTIYNSVLSGGSNPGDRGSGNIFYASPQFVGGNDYHLLPSSPAIDAGTHVFVFEDFDGNHRPLDIPGVGQDGNGLGFDCGAYEFTPAPPPHPRTDINEDGMRDATDLLLLLEDWGRVSGPD